MLPITNNDFSFSNNINSMWSATVDVAEIDGLNRIWLYLACREIYEWSIMFSLIFLWLFSCTLHCYCSYVCAQQIIRVDNVLKIKTTRQNLFNWSVKCLFFFFFSKHGNLYSYRIPSIPTSASLFSSKLNSNWDFFVNQID